MGYVRLAEQQEAVERGHALIGKLHADHIAMDAHPSGRPAKGRDDNARLKDEIASNQSTKAMLQHAPEMEAIGLLTARIAHDFNNLLMAVGGSAELISTDLSSELGEFASHCDHHTICETGSYIDRAAAYIWPQANPYSALCGLLTESFE